MNTTFFDLLWQLKQELELKGADSIDLPTFIDNVEYRRQVLETVDLKALSPEFRQILPELLEGSKLDITRQVRSLPQVRKPRAGGPVHTVDSCRKGPGVMTGVFIVMLLLVGVAALVELAGDKVASDLISTAGIKGGQEESAPVMPTPAVVPAAVAAAAASTPKAPTETLFRLHGSNTIGETLAPELLKAFWQQQGAVDVRVAQGAAEVEKDILFSLPGQNAEQRIELKAHGSSTGFQSLMGREADLAMSSRRIKEQEKSRLAPLYGDLGGVRTEHVVGMDGLAVIVHPGNPVSSLSTDTLARLFAGQIRNWRDLGGPDEPVRIYSRDENSGTWDSFKSMVLNKHGVKLAEHARRFESSMELSDRVSQDPGAIGFIGLPYVLRAKALAVADEEGGLPVFPTTFTVSTEDYPLSRRLYMYEPMTLSLQSPAHQFISFVASEEGQEVVRRSGFISQNIQRIQPVLGPELPQEYLSLVQGGSRLSLNFRFNSGTFELDNKAQRDLERVIRFFEMNPGQRAFLIGFSDSTGNPEHNRRLSLQRAGVVRDQLLARGINVADVHGLGDLAPVASNATPAGRERNRRVEVWVRGNGGNLAQAPR